MSAVPGQQDRSLSTQIPVISASAIPMVRPDEEIGGVDLQLPEREPPQSEQSCERGGMEVDAVLHQ